MCLHLSLATSIATAPMGASFPLGIYFMAFPATQSRCLLLCASSRTCLIAGFTEFVFVLYTSL